MNLSDMEIFFNTFVSDFASFKGKVIASRYTSPYMSVSSDAEIKVLNNNLDTAAYFQEILDNYYQDGIRSCRYKNFKSLLIGDNYFLVTVTWEMLSTDDIVISEWRESYNIIKTKAGFKICTSMDH